jgi:hypothetical protein
MKKSQEDIILEHLQQNGSITSWEAITRYRITRISAHIHTLRGRGHDITTEWKTNNGKNFGIYSLAQKGQMSFL